jgi:DNA-binding MarR family transcriptional regulator
MQLLKTQASQGVTAFGRLIRAGTALIRELNVGLADHGLTVSDYEVLVLLSRADDRRMRRVDLAEEIVLSPSGITRMLNRLEGAGLVEKDTCDSDARVTYARLTDEGAAKVKEVWPRHKSDLERIFGERLNDEELESLAGLLGRLPGAEDAQCEPPGEA